MFADFIHKHFKEALKKVTIQIKLFLYDGDTSQNIREANNAMYKLGAKNSV